MTTFKSSEAKKYWDEDWGQNWKSAWWPVSDFAQKTYPIVQREGLKDVLDLGSGNGRDSLFFAENGLSVTAVDISEVAIKMLQKKNKAITAIAGDVADIDFPDDSFDAVYGHLILHYFNHKDVDRIIKKIHKSLRKGGYVFLKCKSVEDPLYGKGEKLEENVYFYEHLRHFFTKNYMQEILKDFEIVEINQIGPTSRKIGHKYNEAAFIEAIVRK